MLDYIKLDFELDFSLGLYLIRFGLLGLNLIKLGCGRLDRIRLDLRLGVGLD